MSTDIVPVPVLAHGDSIAIHSTQRGATDTHVPTIVNHLKQFTLGAGVLEAEQARYAALADERPLTPSERAVQVAHAALASGRVLVDISSIMGRRTPDLEDQWGRVIARRFPYPALGLAHVGDTRVTCRLYRNGLVQFLAGRRQLFELQTKHEIDIPHSPVFQKEWVSRDAVVPTLPPELAGKYTSKDTDKILVWEATWIDTGNERIRERRVLDPGRVLDPALLEHVAGSLYAVIAVWDLSAVEAAVLGPKVG